MIALCSQCYYIDDQDSEKTKNSTNGMSKRQNNITWKHFDAALKAALIEPKIEEATYGQQ